MKMENPKVFSALECAVLPVILSFYIFVGTVGLGMFDGLNRLGVCALLLIGILLAWRWFFGLQEYGKAFMQGFSGLPTFKWILLFSLIMLLLSPGVGDDSQVYHLPNIAYMLNTGSPSDFQPDLLYRPAAITTYYPRGFETICSVFYAFPSARTLIILLKCFLFSGLYFLFLDEGKNRLVAASFFVICLSMQFVRDDLGNLKNDLMMAIPLVYAATVVCARHPMQSGLWMVPIACALALSIKASALLYAAPILLMWLWIYSSQCWKQLACIAGIILPFGLYFYWANWIQTGNPLFPFKIAIGNWTLFAGETGNLIETSIIANLDATLPYFFMRGLLRVAGPGGMLLLVSLLLIIPVSGLFWRRDSRYWKQASLLILWTLVFLITPFTDHNGSLTHNQLFSGGTIRMALPAVLLGCLMLSRITANWVGDSQGRANVVFWMVAGASLINLFWYDSICLIAKPENALAAVASVGQTFDLRILGLIILLVGALCAAMVYLKRRWLVAGMIISAACIQQLVYPQSLTYSMRFKQIGQTSNMFQFLSEQNFGRDVHVAIHSEDESSFFLACVNDYLLPRAERMHYMESNGSVSNADWIIICAKDSFNLNDRIKGRQYRISWDFLDEMIVPDGYIEVFLDEFYKVYHKKG